MGYFPIATPNLDLGIAKKHLERRLEHLEDGPEYLTLLKDMFGIYLGVGCDALPPVQEG